MVCVIDLPLCCMEGEKSIGLPLNNHHRREIYHGGTVWNEEHMGVSSEKEEAAESSFSGDIDGF